MNKRVQIKKGIFYLGNKPIFLVTADYPYYRDDAGNWDDRLRKIKDAGIDAVTFYTPWRHHAHKTGGKIVLDFDGKTQQNRNVKLFLELCKKNRLWAVVKPGPFIYAETNFGGLPDWVSPDEDKKIEPFLDNNGKPRNWHKTLPAPFSGRFKAQVRDWYGQVDSNIIRNNVYPKGSIIAIQVCNEGIYSNAPAPITRYDYSPSSLSLYRKFMKGKDSRAPRAFSGIKAMPDLKVYLGWGRWQSEYMRLIYKEFSSPIKSKVPLVININPPAKGKGLDHWLARVIPERWPGINYGFTNWLKPVSEDASSFDRYSFLAKRKRGVNLEGNWGFSKLYDTRFQYPVICVFETLLAVANGATGFNVYTAVNTASWDDLLDNRHERPYPDSSPIRENGELTKKYEVLSLLSGFFKENGADLLGCKPDREIAWGLYPPYACLAAWDIPRMDWEKLGVEPVKCGRDGLDEFQRDLRGENMDFQIANIESVPIKELKAHKNILLHGGFFMDRNSQRKLLRYARAGGRLIFLKTVPSLDENFKRYGILEGSALCLPAMEDALELLKNSDRRLNVKDPSTQVRVYENEKKKIRFFFVLNLSEISGIKEFSYAGKPVKIALAAKSAAVIRVDNSKLAAVFIKGINEMRQSSVIPAVSFGKDELKVKTPCDLTALKIGNKWRIRSVA